MHDHFSRIPKRFILAVFLLLISQLSDPTLIGGDYDFLIILVHNLDSTEPDIIFKDQIPAQVIFLVHLLIQLLHFRFQVGLHVLKLGQLLVHLIQALIRCALVALLIQ